MRAGTLISIVNIDRITATKGRKLVFLVVNGDKEVNAKTAYDGLSRKGQKHLRHSFQLWLDGIPKDHRHHGFNASQHNGAYTECYVFKHDQDRLFGFLCHPDPDKPRQEYCVLVHTPTKEKIPA